MTRIKRAVVAFGAWAGWGGASAVTVGAQFHELASAHPFLVNRLFALLALAATVLSIAWLIDRARKPVIPVEAETAYNLGVKAGKDIGRMEASLGAWNGPNRGLNPMVGGIMGDSGAQPIRWRS